MKKLFLLPMIMVLSACSTTQPSSVILIARCPDVPQYTADFSNRLVDYLAKTPPSAELSTFLLDAEHTREEAKACIQTRDEWEQTHQSPNSLR